MKSLLTLEETTKLIQKGERLLVAGDESLLAKLPRGEWVGGTIPYFMSEEGGLCTREKMQVTVLPDFVRAATCRMYGPKELARIPEDYQPSGFSYIVIPAMTEAHETFAKDCSTWRGVFNRPLIGWIAGVHLEDLGKVKPKVVNGETGEISSERAVVMHLDLASGKRAEVNIVNLFRQGHGDRITFPNEGFEVGECQVNGQKRCFAEYVESKKINRRQPLVADYMGAMVNVSFQKVDAAKGKVTFYAPVFPGVEYRLAEPVADYEAEFHKQLNGNAVRPTFTCNCILNYLYAKLEGKKMQDVVGPITFGEVAYMLLNQTFVYLTFAE